MPMNFLFPLGLLGLLALPVILLLHLLRERPRRRPVPSILLWQRLASVQRHPEPRRLPLTLLLLLHLLVATLLAFALARPALPGIGSGRARHTIILLDTSTSMGATDVAPTRFQSARGRLAQYYNALGANDTLTLIRLSPTAEIVSRTSGSTANPANLDQLQLAPAGASLDLRGGLNLANGVLDPERANRIVILSDATWLPETLEPVAQPVGAPITWEPLGGPAANQAIVSFASRPRPVGGIDLIARVVNFEDAPVERTLRLLGTNRGDGSESVLGDHPLSLPANGEIVQHWILPGAEGDGPELVQVELSGSDAQPLDDRAALSLAEHESLSVRFVGPEVEALRRVLEALPGLRVEANVAPEDAALTVYHGELPESFPGGPVLLLNPPSGAEALQPEATNVSPPSPPGDPLVRDLDLSSVTFDGPSPPMPEWAEPVLVDSERPSRVLIWRGTSGPTRVIALNFDLARSNLPAKLAFPLLMARIVAELTPAGIPSAIVLGEPLVFPWNAADFRVLDPSGSDLPVEEQGNTRVVRPQAPGIHTVELAGRVIARFAAQAGAPLESDLRPSQRERLPAIAQVPLVEQRAGSPFRDLAPWLVAAALIVLVLEQIYERRLLKRKL